MRIYVPEIGAGKDWGLIFERDRDEVATAAYVPVGDTIPTLGRLIPTKVTVYLFAARRLRKTNDGNGSRPLPIDSPFSGRGI